MGSRRLCCPTGAHRGARNLLRVARTRAVSGAAGEELGSGKRCSRQPAHRRSPRSTEHPSGAPLSPGHSKLSTGRRHKGTVGAEGAGAGSRRGCWEWWSLCASVAALQRGSASITRELRMRAHFRLARPRPLGPPGRGQLSSTRRAGGVAGPTTPPSRPDWPQR